MSDYPLTSTWAEVDAAAQAVKNGLPKANLSGAVQASLDKADGAVQVGQQRAATDWDTEEAGIDENGKIVTRPSMSDEAKYSLLNLLSDVAYATQNGAALLADLEDKLFPTRHLSSITAAYDQDRPIHATDSLDLVKLDLVVTANYSDGTTEVVTDYTLSGTLVAGETCEVTVSYGGKTATINVVVSEQYEYALSSGLIKKNIGALGHDTTHGMYIGANNANRRNFLLDHGEHPMIITTNGSTYAESTLYPIPVPTNATKVTVSITPNTQYLVIEAARWNGTIWEYLGETGWQLGSYTYTLPAGATHIGIASKYNSSGSSYPTEPTELTVTFSD